MKRFAYWFSVFAVISVIVLAIAGPGCQSEVQTATNADAVVIPTVNAAMTTFAAFANAGKATPAQIATVSNAYALYYNAQLTASNFLALSVANPSTNATAAAQTALAAALASQTNLVLIVQSLTK